MNDVKIIFTLDGTGIAYNPGEPIHLDALVDWILRPLKLGSSGGCMNADDPVSEINLPFAKHDCGNGAWVWKASALFPDGDFETLIYWRKKFRQARADITKGSPNLQNATYREYNTPLPVKLCRTLTAYAVTFDRGDLQKMLRQKLKYLGKKRSIGLGKIVSVDVENVDYDWSIAKTGFATRYLPHPDGLKVVRPRPPYWNIHHRTNCLVAGDQIIP